MIDGLYPEVLSTGGVVRIGVATRSTNHGRRNRVPASSRPIRRRPHAGRVQSGAQVGTGDEARTDALPPGPPWTGAAVKIGEVTPSTEPAERSAAGRF